MSPEPQEPRKEYVLENSRLLLQLLLIGQACLGASVISSVIYLDGPTLWTRAFSLATAVLGTVFTILLVVTIWNSSVVKPKEIARVLNLVPWGGDEIVGDIGSGMGLLSSKVVTKLSEGFVIGFEHSKRMAVDSRKSLGSSPLESQGRAYIVESDERTVPIGDGKIDIAFFGFGVKHFRRLADRILVGGEVMRILKPGGSLVMLVNSDPIETTVLLKEEGLLDITTSPVRSFIFSPATLVTARKSTRV